MLIAMGAAAWPVWRWYFLRMTDGSDEPWGVLAIVSLVMLRLRDGAPQRLSERRFALPAAMLALYAIGYPILPPLVRAILVLAAFGVVLLRGPGAAGQAGLLALSLPLMATMQFYLGFPLRLLAAEASAVVLRFCEYMVVREGTLLHWAGETVIVDAPCSGIQMLWSGLFLASLLAAFYRLSAARAAICGAAAVVIVVLANMMRATALFFKEAEIVSLADWTHAGIGTAIFCGAAWLITSIVQKLQPRPCIA
jgi:exosortase